MRVRPSIGWGIGLSIAYMLVFGGMFKFLGVDYDLVGDSSENVLKGVVIPVAIALAVFAIVTTIFGWWKPVMRDRRRAGGWPIALPIIAVVIMLVVVDYGNLPKLDTNFLLLVVIGTILVGISEELMYRGLVVVSFRSSMREGHVWLWSSVAFGLLHLSNVVLGQDLMPTLQQVALTTVIGSVMYIARRTTGSIIMAMVIHALWDFTVFTQGGDGAMAGKAQFLILGLTILTLIFGRHHLFGTSDDPVEESVSTA